MACSQYGFCGEAALQECKGNIILNLGRAGIGFLRRKSSHASACKKIGQRRRRVRGRTQPNEDVI